MLLVVVGLWLYGIYGLLIGSVITSWFIYFVNAWLASKHVGYTLKQQFYDLFPIITISTVAYIVSLSIGYITNLGLCIKGIVQFLVFASVYISLSVLFKVEFLASTKYTLKVLGNKVKH